jgi:hypothetical protein
VRAFQNARRPRPRHCCRELPEREEENAIDKLFLLAVLLPLTGCLPQKEREAVQANVSCLSAAYASPDAAPLRVREPFNVNDATLAQLADTSFAT